MTLEAFDGAIGVFGETLGEGRQIRGPVNLTGSLGTDGHAFEAAHALRGIAVALLVCDGHGLSRADLNAGAAADALLLVDVHMAAVLVFLAALGSAAHGQILDGTAETGGLMALEMRKHDHGRGMDDFGGDVHSLEMLAVDFHGKIVLSEKAVGDNHGSVHHAGGEAVTDGRIDMIHGVVARSGIKRRCVGQKRQGAGLTHLLHSGLNKLRVEVPVASGLTKVQFDGTGAAGDHDILELQKIAEAGNLGFLVLVLRTAIHSVIVNR